MSAVSAALLRAAAILDDPDQVVLDPDNLWETADGRIADHQEQAARYCFMGAVMRAVDETPAASGYEVHRALEPYMLAADASFTSYLRDYGAAACADPCREAAVA